MKGPRPKTAHDWTSLALETAEPWGDCLLATRWKPTAKGYIRVGSTRLLHRLVAEVKIKRELASEETVDHACHNTDPSCPGGSACLHRRCVNPDHLEVVDAVTNWKRGGLGAVALRRALTHCPQNHPYSGYNLVVKKDGARRCRTCENASRRRRRARQRS